MDPLYVHTLPDLPPSLTITLLILWDSQHWPLPECMVPPLAALDSGPTARGDHPHYATLFIYAFLSMYLLCIAPHTLTPDPLGCG